MIHYLTTCSLRCKLVNMSLGSISHPVNHSVSHTIFQPHITFIYSHNQHFFQFIKQSFSYIYNHLNIWSVTKIFYLLLSMLTQSFYQSIFLSTVNIFQHTVILINRSNNQSVSDLKLSYSVIKFDSQSVT